MILRAPPPNPNHVTYFMRVLRHKFCECTVATSCTLCGCDFYGYFRACNFSWFLPIPPPFTYPSLLGQRINVVQTSVVSDLSISSRARVIQYTGLCLPALNIDLSCLSHVLPFWRNNINGSYFPVRFSCGHVLHMHAHHLITCLYIIVSGQLTFNGNMQLLEKGQETAEYNCFLIH